MRRAFRSVAAASGSVVLAVGGALAAITVIAPPARALTPVNPVEIDLAGHPANSGFLVFVENDVSLRSDESEGTLAMGGDLRLGTTYQIGAGSAPVRPTYTAPGDARPTYLHVGGGINWANDGAQVRVENGGYTKVADTSTYTAHESDSNGAAQSYRLTRPGRPYESTPFLEGRSRQSPASIGTPVPSSLIDIPGAFAVFRDLTAQMARCPSTVGLVDDQGDPIARPFPENTRGRLTLVAGETNVLSLSAEDLRDLSEITFTNRPTASTPLLVNVTGRSYIGNMPNLAGIGGSQAPFILWNFPDATTVRVGGGASVEGTLYAPNATLTWVPTQNIEGNVIARNFNHGVSSRLGNVREVHDFPFSTTLSCAGSTTSARLTLVKEVENDHGGRATPDDWTLAADGPTTIEGPTGTSDVTQVQVPPGGYQLSEAGGPLGYRPSGWTCTGGTLADDTLTLTDGDDATCTIVNRDRPAMITLVKKVVNDDAGTALAGDWTLSADGPTPVSGASGTREVTRAAVDAGAYDLAESGGPDGYESGAWVCSSDQIRSAARVVLEPGDRVTCTITNDDVAGQSDDGRDDDSGSDGESGTGDSTAPGSPEDSAVTEAGTGLPDTGAPFASWLVVLGGALLLGGSGLVVAARLGSAGQVRRRGP